MNSVSVIKNLLKKILVERRTLDLQEDLPSPAQYYSDLRQFVLRFRKGNMPIINSDNIDENALSLSEKINSSLENVVFFLAHESGHAVLGHANESCPLALRDVRGEIHAWIRGWHLLKRIDFVGPARNMRYCFLAFKCVSGYFIGWVCRSKRAT